MTTTTWRPLRTSRTAHAECAVGCTAAVRVVRSSCGLLEHVARWMRVAVKQLLLIDCAGSSTCWAASVGCASATLSDRGERL